MPRKLLMKSSPTMNSTKQLKKSLRLRVVWASKFRISFELQKLSKLDWLPETARQRQIAKISLRKRLLKDVRIYFNYFYFASHFQIILLLCSLSTLIGRIWSFIINTRRIESEVCFCRLYSEKIIHVSERIKWETSQSGIVFYMTDTASLKVSIE